MAIDYKDLKPSYRGLRCPWDSGVEPAVQHICVRESCDSWCPWRYDVNDRGGRRGPVEICGDCEGTNGEECDCDWKCDARAPVQGLDKSDGFPARPYISPRKKSRNNGEAKATPSLPLENKFKTREANATTILTTEDVAGRCITDTVNPSMYDTIVQLVRSGKDTYNDIAKGLGIDKRYVKGPVQKIVKAGGLDWDGFAHLKVTGLSLRGQVLKVLGDEPGLSRDQLNNRGILGSTTDLEKTLDELLSSWDIRREKQKGAGYAERYYLAEKSVRSDIAVEPVDAERGSGSQPIKIFCLGCHVSFDADVINMDISPIIQGYKKHVEDHHGSFKKMLSDMCSGSGNCFYCGQYLPIRDLEEHIIKEHNKLADGGNRILAELYTAILPEPTRRRLHELGEMAKVQEVVVNKPAKPEKPVREKRVLRGRPKKVKELPRQQRSLWDYQEAGASL